MLSNDDIASFRNINMAPKLIRPPTDGSVDMMKILELSISYSYYIANYLTKNAYRSNLQPFL